MVSVWKEFLVLSRLPDGQIEASICQYESLAEWHPEEDEDGVQQAVPDEYNGFAVAGVEDGYIVGGPPICWHDQRTKFGSQEIGNLSQWAAEEWFALTADELEVAREFAGC